RQHRLRRPDLPRHEGGEDGKSEDERADDLRRAPPDRVAADEAPDDPEQAGAREHEPAQVEPLGRAVGLVQPRQRERDEQQAEGPVEPEDPVPGDPADDGAADERAEGDRETADPAPRAEREATLL